MISQISQNVYKLYFDTFGSCVYVLKLGKNILIDTSSEDNKEELLKDLKELKLKPEDIEIVLLTHRHWDHDGNLSLFSEAKVYSKNNISDLSSENLQDFKVIKTPGHTKDSICFLYKDILFSGDTVFYNGGIGRTDLIESVPEKMQSSLDKINNLSYRILCPGHND